MLKDVIVKGVGKKGRGLFAARDFKKGEVIIRNDITKIKKRYSLKEIEESGIDSEHWDYAGHNMYVLDHSPESYINHSCSPNSYAEFKVIGKRAIIALRDIKKGEEITKFYSLEAIERMAGKNPDELLKCRCGSKNCIKNVTMDFFKLPKKTQKERLPYLPTWVKRKYKDRIRKIK